MQWDLVCWQAAVVGIYIPWLLRLAWMFLLSLAWSKGASSRALGPHLHPKYWNFLASNKLTVIKGDPSLARSHLGNGTIWLCRHSEWGQEERFDGKDVRLHLGISWWHCKSLYCPWASLDEDSWPEIHNGILHHYCFRPCTSTPH